MTVNECECKLTTYTITGLDKVLLRNLYVNRQTRREVAETVYASNVFCFRSLDPIVPFL